MYEKILSRIVVKNPMRAPFMRAMITVPMPIASKWPMPNMANDIITAITKNVISNPVLYTGILILKYAETSLTKNS